MEGMLIIHIGLDCIQGTLFDDNGEEIMTIKKDIKLHTHMGYKEQDACQWFDTVVSIIKDIQNNSGEVTIDYMTVTYEPGTFVCIDRLGNPIYNAILSWDPRGSYELETFRKANIKSYDHTHIEWNYMALSKLFWIKQNRPDIYGKIYKILTPDGFIAYKLCGETAVDTYSALFMGYSIKSMKYNNKILDILNLDVEQFPQVRKPGECISIISGEVKESLKLKSDVKFLISTNSLIALTSLCDDKVGKSILYDLNLSMICFTNNYIKSNKSSSFIRIPYKEKNLYIYGCMVDNGLYMLNKVIDFTECNNSMGEISKNYSPCSNGIMILPCRIKDHTSHNSYTLSILGINSCIHKDNLLTAYYETLGYILKERIEQLLYNEIKVDNIKLLSPIKDEIFYNILSHITNKNIIVSKDVSCIDGIYNIISHDKVKKKIEDKVILPDLEQSRKYEGLYNMYKTVGNSLKKIYRHKSEMLRE